MNPQRWVLAIPPEGAARSVALHTANAFLQHLPADAFKTIDAVPYLNGFRQLLKKPDDTMTVDLFNQAFAVACLDFQPTHCLVAALAPVTLFTLQLLRKHGIRSAHWFFEDYRRTPYWKSVLEGYDYLFAIQRGQVEPACKTTGVAYHYLSTACACADLQYNVTARQFDVVFIGIPSSYRVSVLEGLAQAGLRLAVAGSGWNNYHGLLEPVITSASWINDEQAFALMQQAKTGINLSFDNPSGRDDVHISPRLYDLCAAGCLPVTENVPLLYDAAPGVEISTFSTTEEAVNVVTGLVKAYSPDDQRIAGNREIILNHHRYTHRVAEIISQTI